MVNCNVYSTVVVNSTCKSSKYLHHLATQRVVYLSMRGPARRGELISIPRGVPRVCSTDLSFGRRPESKSDEKARGTPPYIEIFSIEVEIDRRFSFSYSFLHPARPVDTPGAGPTRVPCAACLLSDAMNSLTPRPQRVSFAPGVLVMVVCFPAAAPACTRFAVRVRDL